MEINKVLRIDNESRTPALSLSGYGRLHMAEETKERNFDFLGAPGVVVIVFSIVVIIVFYSQAASAVYRLSVVDGDDKPCSAAASSGKGEASWRAK